MSGGLLSGLDRVEERPYQGWKTNKLVPSASPENDDVCLLEESSTSGNVEDSPYPTTCLSNGNRNPRDFKAHDSSYKIPKKTVSSNVEVKKGNTWFNSSFEIKQYSVRSKYSQAGLTPGKHRNDTDRITHKNEIGYRVVRQTEGSFISPSRRWKHASAPGWRQTEVSQSQKEMMLSCQVPDTKRNGTVSTNEKPECIQRHFQAVDKTQPKSNLAEEYKQNRSVSDSIFKQKSTPVIRPDKDKHKDENVGANSSDSDIQAKTRIASQLDSPHSSITKDISQDNCDDLFEDHCEKCLKKFLQGKKCPNCENNVFPSQAATPRKTLSPDRFYSVDSERSKVRTYGKPHGNGPRLLLARSDAKSADSENAVDSCQTNTRFRKRKNKGKSAIESDSDYSPGRPKRSGKQLKLALPKKVDVITLSDEEEVIETSTELIVEQSSHNTDADSFESTSSGPGLLRGIEDDKDGDQNSDSTGVKKTKSVTVKRKTPPSQETQPAAKKKSDILHGYTRDDAEIEIMIRQDVRIGTLACTATEPLKIICKTDEIKLGVDYGLKNMSLTIAGNDLTSFKMSQSSNPNVIVLGVTPGYAIKLCQKLPKQRKFLNPGSAISAERDIVLEVSENVKREVIADVAEWVTDKLSKEFDELSLTEVDRIKSFKSSPSTTKEQKSEPNEVSSTPLTTRSRTYNTRASSYKQPAKTVEKLFVYPPPPQPGGITVTSDDIRCLAEEEFLNDVIIDFYLKFVFYEKLKPEDRKRTHILSSFFYKRLTQRNNSLDNHGSTPDRMHSQVKTWTKNVDIFEKDFVFVPINENSHWYLAVICFAGHTEATYINEITDEDDETGSKDKDSETGTDKESENGNDGSEEEDADFELPALAKLQSAYSKPRRKKSLSKQTIKSQPCILVFDSLGGQRARCMFNLRNYLQVEWKVRRKESESREFTKDNIKGSHPKVPQQDNFCDCGVYVLQYMDSFFEDPITDFSLPIKKTDWFPLETIAQKRSDIRELIFKLKAAYRNDNHE